MCVIYIYTQDLNAVHSDVIYFTSIKNAHVHKLACSKTQEMSILYSVCSKKIH